MDHSSWLSWNLYSEQAEECVQSPSFFHSGLQIRDQKQYLKRTLRLTALIFPGRISVHLVSSVTCQ